MNFNIYIYKKISAKKLQFKSVYLFKNFSFRRVERLVFKCNNQLSNFSIRFCRTHFSVPRFCDTIPPPLKIVWNYWKSVSWVKYLRVIGKELTLWLVELFTRLFCRLVELFPMTVVHSAQMILANNSENSQNHGTFCINVFAVEQKKKKNTTYEFQQLYRFLFVGFKHVCFCWFFF